MTKSDYLKKVKNKSNFSRQELLQSFRNGGFQLSDSSFSKEITSMIKSGEIIRIGKNVYSFPREEIRPYNHEYSELAKEVASLFNYKFPLADFTVLELIQLNEFTNHQIAHNVIFLSVEPEIMNFVFDAMKERYFGKVLINPTSEIYHQYWSDNMIVIVKLATESPKDRSCSWHIRLEKLLVDIMSDPLLLASISESEYPNIFENAFSKYVVDENCMFRYARRRGNDGKIRNLIEEKTDIELRTRR